MSWYRITLTPDQVGLHENSNLIRRFPIGHSLYMKLGTGGMEPETYYVAPHTVQKAMELIRHYSGTRCERPEESEVMPVVFGIDGGKFPMNGLTESEGTTQTGE